MIVEMPDGQNVSFPDDMSQDQIWDIISEKYPKEVKNYLDEPDPDLSKLSGMDVMNDSGVNSKPSSKLDVMLSLGSLIAKSDKRLEPVQTGITAIRTFTNTDYSKLGSEGAKSLGRQAVGLTVGSTGFHLKLAGEMLHDDVMKEEDFNKEIPFNTAYALWKGNQFVSDTIRGMGESLENLSEKMQSSDLLKEDENLFAGSFEENPNLHKVLDLSMSGASSLVGGYTVAKVTKSPALALWMMSGYDAKDIFEEAVESGESKEKAFGLWTLGTLGTAALEKVGLEKAFNVKITKKGMQAIVDSSKKTSEKILDSVLANAGEEGLQTVWQNTVAKVGYDETRDIFQNALESAIGGALGGGLVTSFDYGIQAFNKKSKNAGLSKNEQDKILTTLGESIANNPNLVDAPLQENIKKAYNSFSKMIEEMGDSPEKQRLIATKKALDEGYTKYYEELKNFMPEEQAKANASLLRSSALFFSDLDGITADEWLKTKAPEIKRMTSDMADAQHQFAGQKAKNASLEKLTRAKQLNADGVDNEKIRQDTGWFKGIDGKWRFEISDKDAKVKLKDVYKKTLQKDFDEQQYVLQRFGRFADTENPEAQKVQKKIENIQNKMDTLSDDTIYKYMQESGVNYNYTLEDILEHDKLYEAYPELKNVWVKFVKDENNTGGTTTLYPDGSAVIEVNIASDKESFSYANLKKTLVHEIQHIIQKEENFAKGSNLEAYKGYLADLKHQFKKYVTDLFTVEAKKEFGVKIKYYDALKMIADIFQGEHENKQYLYDNYNLDRVEFTKYMRSKGKEFSEKEDAWREENAKKIPTSAYGYYFRTAGEVEARNTEARMNMDETERLATPVEQTQDVKNEDAFVVFSDGTTLAYKPEAVNQITDPQEKVTAELNSDSNNIEFNMESLKDKTSVDYLKSIALSNGMTNKQFDSLMNKVFDVADTINDALKGNPDWKNWNAKQIKTFVDAQGVPLPIRSIFVKNGDYDFNIDLGTLCVKREFADKVIKHLIDKGYGDQIGLVKLEQIKALLRKYEIAVACDVCFIEGKRLNARTLSNGLAYEWESVRNALGITDDLSIGSERTFSDIQEEMLNQMTDRRFIKDDGSIMSEEEYDKLSAEEKKDFAKTHQMVFQKAYEDYMPIERRRVKIGNTVYDRGITSDKMYSIAKLFKQNSELAGVFDPDYLMNSEQTTALAEMYYDTELPSFLGSYAGAGTPKPLYGFNPYYELSWRDKYDRNPDKLNEMIFSIGGVRGQSFSDYNEMLVIDYIQKYLAETVRALPAHEYTKQASLVKTFGDTGVMFNMSFVPKIEDGVDSKHYGLRKATEEEIKQGKSKEGFMLREDSQGVWTYSFHSDSFPVGEAMQLRNQFDKTSGIIVVGVSDMQIEMLLDDPNIDMVIPFHASGMPAHTKLMTGLVDVDYSKEQTTKGLKKGQEDFSYNAELRKIGDPRKTAQAYKDWCKKNKLTEKFPQFSNNKNYYKLLEDFRGYDKNGKPIIQGAVDISKADWNRITQEAISGVKERTGVVESAEESLVSEEFTKELEDIFKYQQVDTEVQNLFKKRLTSVLGKGNAVFLKQDKFLEKVRELTGAEVFRNNQDGTVYGFAVGNKVFLNESVFNAHTPAHEFTHIWAKVVQQYNPKLWKKGVGLLKQTNMWKDVQKDEMYWQIQGDENAVAREVLARLTGTESEAMIRQMLDYHTKGHANAKSLIDRIMKFLKEMFGVVKDAFNLNSNVNITFDDFIRMPLRDLLDTSRHKAFRNAMKKTNLDGASEFNQNRDYVPMENAFYQNEQSPLGAYKNRVIYLNETANASTLPHELAHFWSDELKQSKSPRAKEILKQADVWENKEFERKYSVAKQGDVFVVTNKDGTVLYDRMGNGFATEEQAKAYAKEELFARGFEKYLKEGKAPNKTLKTAFRNFYNWLKKLYVDMMNLDIKLSPTMRNLYAEILGGTSIDTFLDSDLDEFIDRRVEAEEDKSKQVQGIIKQAQDANAPTLPDKIRKAWEDFDFGETWKKIAVPLSTRAKRISPRLRNKLRHFEFDVMDAKQNYYRAIESMLKKWNTFSKDDIIAFDLALKNGAIDIRDSILEKYDAVEDFAKVQEVLEDIYEQATNAGLEVGYLEDYFPRKVSDKDGLMEYLHSTDEWSGFQQALQREDPRNEFTAEEQAEFIDKYLRGIVRADLASYKYSSEKQRKLDIIDNNLNKYYADSMQALISYIDGMNARIQTVNFFGRNRENIDESIGEFIAYMLNNNEIKPSQVDEVKFILDAVFKRRGVNSRWIKSFRDVGYIYTMGGVNTAITQLDDIFVAAYKGGVINTFKAALSKDVVTKKDLGLESIAAEFMNGSGTSKAVNWVFTHNGIEKIDSFGKNALLNGVLTRMQKMSDEELKSYVEPIMEEETDSTIKDIRNKNLSANVRFFLFNELSDMQPVSLSELPELYNIGGNTRIFYMLKSFMLKRIDTIRNECYDKIKSGDKAERIKGWQNLYRLVFLMMLGGATKDLIIDLMYGRVVDISDMMVNNLLGIMGISKYNIYQVREEGLGHTLAIFATPPLLQVAEDLSGDVNKYINGKREFKDFEVFKGLPIIGRFYYWWYGGGKTKTEKKKKRGS